MKMVLGMVADNGLDEAVCIANDPDQRHHHETASTDQVDLYTTRNRDANAHETIQTDGEDGGWKSRN